MVLRFSLCSVLITLFHCLFHMASMYPHNAQHTRAHTHTRLHIYTHKHIHTPTINHKHTANLPYLQSYLLTSPSALHSVSYLHPPNCPSSPCRAGAAIGSRVICLSDATKGLLKSHRNAPLAVCLVKNRMASML
jgi:hypothetical protein